MKTISEMIEELIKLQESVGPDAKVMVATVPKPFPYDIMPQPADSPIKWDINKLNYVLIRAEKE